MDNILFSYQAQADYEKKSDRLAVSPLIKSISSQDYGLTKMLIKDLGADVNFADDHKMTPLMHAVKTVSVLYVSCIPSLDVSRLFSWHGLM